MNKFMKTAVCSALAGIMALSLFSCGEYENSDNSSDSGAEISNGTDDDRNSDPEIKELIDSDDFQSVLEMIRQPDDLLQTGMDTTNARVGSYVQTAILDSDLTLEQNETLFFPVICGDAIAAFITVSSINGNYNCGAGVWIAEKLNKILSSGKKAALVSINEGICLIDENDGVTVLFCNGEDYLSGAGLTYDEVSRFNNVVSMDSIITNE